MTHPIHDVSKLDEALLLCNQPTNSPPTHPHLKVGPTGYLPTCSHNCWSERRYLQVVSTAPFGNMPRKFLFPWHPDSIKQDSQMSPQASIYSGIPWRITAVVKQKQSMFNMAQHDSCISIGPVYTHSFIHSSIAGHSIRPLCYLAI